MLGSVARVQPALSVVLSTLGNYTVLRRVLDGYSAQDAARGSFEVIVAMDKNDPEPESVDEAIGERGYPIRRITGDTPGLSANRNAGCRAAQAPLVMFTDNDTIPLPKVVSEHLAWHRRHPQEEVGVLGHVRWAPELEVSTFMRWLERGMQFDYANIEGDEAGWGRFYGANVSLKRAFVERVGGFDAERLPYGYEDTDWAYRASHLGFRLMYARAAVVDHLRPMTLDFWKKRVRRVAAAERQFTALHPEVEPWYFQNFTWVLTMRPARGRGLWLARVISPSVPWLGPRVWSSVDLAYRQELAPHFLEAWHAFEEGGDRTRPDLSEFGTP